MANKTPREVAAAIRADFRANNLTIKEAAAKCDISPASLSAALARGTYIGRVTARRLASTFGYDLSFLYTGAGTLRADTAATAESTTPAADVQLRQILSICVSLSSAIVSLQRLQADALARIGAIEEKLR